MTLTHRKCFLVSTASPLARVTSGMHSIQPIATSNTLAALEARRIDAYIATGRAMHAVCDVAESAAPVMVFGHVQT